MKDVEEILNRNGFVPHDYNIFYNGKCYITIHKDHYEVDHYDENFLEYMTWYSNDLNIPALMGHLSWHDFIERGYSK